MSFWSIFEGIRRVVIFALGVLIFLDGLILADSTIAVTELILGMIMVGILPVDTLFTRFVNLRKEKDK